jgi:hypothetical protein
VLDFSNNNNNNNVAFQLISLCGVKDFNRSDLKEGTGLLQSEAFTRVVVGVRSTTVKLRTAGLMAKRLNP